MRERRELQTVAFSATWSWRTLSFARVRESERNSESAGPMSSTGAALRAHLAPAVLADRLAGNHVAATVGADWTFRLEVRADSDDEPADWTEDQAKEEASANAVLLLPDGSAHQSA